MLGVIVTTHGDLAKGLLHSAEMVIGKTNINYLGLDDLGIETYEKKLYELLDKSFENYQSILVLCDLKGGTPFNTALRYKLEKEKDIEVVTGVNLPMLIETSMSRDTGGTLENLINTAIESGKDGIEKINI